MLMNRCGRLLAIAAALLFATANVAHAQDKVIKTTKDKSGFEKQLTEVDMMHQTASQLMSVGQWDKAAEELERVVAKDPARIEGWEDLAKCYKNLEQFDKAAQAYMSAHKLQPGDLDLMSNLGYAQLAAEQLEQAMATYVQMLELNPLSYDANVHLGFIYLKNDDTDKAVGFYEKALEGNPTDVQTLGSLAQIYADKGAMEKSIEYSEKAIAAAPEEQKKALRSKLGKTLLASKQFDKAATVYGELCAEDPENAGNQFNLGISLMQAKKHTDAVPHLEKVIALRPEYGQAYQYLAQCYSGTGQYSKAVTTIQKGLPLADDKAGLYYTWGLALEKMTHYDEAIEVFEKIINDATYGEHARRQIQRQLDLKKIEKMKKTEE